MSFDPLAPVGRIVRRGDSGSEFLGCCALFRHAHVALTAAHCVPVDTPQDDLEVVLPRLGAPKRVVDIRRHPEADLAVIVTEPPDVTEGHPANAFWDRVSNFGLGEEFYAYGFPVAGPWTGNVPVARLFVGHYQRFFPFETPTGTYRYFAGEMSLPAPEGLSGGPLFRLGAPQMLTGIVTANMESYTLTESVTMSGPQGDPKVEETRRVVSYGVALMLSHASDWLRANVPPRPGVGWVS